MGRALRRERRMGNVGREGEGGEVEGERQTNEGGGCLRNHLITPPNS